ncbi:uncharacterized protein BXZ73DRAFT_100328 [Epithele typhae]|uniref:uncharacterized protein n=1 Tax=Epithele typhae TaxID=378194 RepID=UPI0020081C87|nr:uncharacterized protein BXZ73DRAFT_100328 [Epithele typhae]KAH9935854.1 hypothetical protein BXZ73DRAFT_100328 [Epithele typhae]
MQALEIWRKKGAAEAAAKKVSVEETLSSRVTAEDASDEDLPDEKTHCQRCKDTRIGTALCDLLGERSQNNSLIEHIIGLYLYTTDVQRQVIAILSALGITSSYPTVAGSSKSLGCISAIPGTEDQDEDSSDSDYVPSTPVSEASVASGTETDCSEADIDECDGLSMISHSDEPSDDEGDLPRRPAPPILSPGSQEPPSSIPSVNRRLQRAPIG